MLFSSESVFPGHPDKMADQISDALLDGLLREDPEARAAIETFVTTGLVVVGGEVAVHNDAARLVLSDTETVVRQVIREIGYDDSSAGFDWRGCAVLRTLHAQSADISRGVTEGEGLHGACGAGDQGLMFGYACDDTESMMPMPIHLSHAISRRLWELRTEHSDLMPWLRPDGKCQVTVRYASDSGRPVPTTIDSVVLSTQHTEAAIDGKTGHMSEEAKWQLIEHAIRPAISAVWESGSDTDIDFHINPTGRFVIGGPHGDTGLTGRKIIVDTYGGMGRHGGGAFSGKDPSKVDRSATYMARYVAKNIVAAGLAPVCEVQLSYAIGMADPVGLFVDTRGTGNDEDIAAAVRRVFDLTPKGIISELELRQPFYRRTAMFGHFGNKDFPWESTIRADELARA